MTNHIVAGNIDSEPIFILGAPRSGTSLLRVQLNRHPAIGLCDETYFFYYIYTRRRAFGNLNDLSVRRQVVTQYLSTNRIKNLQVDASSLSEYLMETGEDYPSLFGALMKFYAHSNGKTRYGEKTPDHVRYMELLTQWYPDCKIIHLVRDPRAVVASLLKMPWAVPNPRACARLWVESNANSSCCKDKQNYRLIRYEDMVQNPESEMRRLCEFLGEEYSPIMLEAGSGNVGKQWWFQRALEPVSQERVDLWRKQLTPHQIALIEEIAGQQMEAFGYELYGGTLPAAARAVAVLDEYLLKANMRFRSLPRAFYYWFQPTQLGKEEAWIDNNR